MPNWRRTGSGGTHLELDPVLAVTSTNTGGGGGAGASNGTLKAFAGASGGSGVVIISYAGSQVFGWRYSHNFWWQHYSHIYSIWVFNPCVWRLDYLVVAGGGGGGALGYGGVGGGGAGGMQTWRRKCYLHQSVTSVIR
jgi:hypothetical protein